MKEITPMQRLRFEKRHNRLDEVESISLDFFLNSGEFEIKQRPTSIDNTLKYDKERGGVFVWSNVCNKYFLVGTKIK